MLRPSSKNQYAQKINVIIFANISSIYISDIFPNFTYYMTHWYAPENNQ